MALPTHSTATPLPARFQNLTTAAWQAEVSAICTSPVKPKCKAVCSLWNGASFDIITPTSSAQTQASGYNFVANGSCAVGVSLASNYSRATVAATNAWVKTNWGVDLNAAPSCAGHVNFCSGSNPHVDLAVNPDKSQVGRGMGGMGGEGRGALAVSSTQ